MYSEKRERGAPTPLCLCFPLENNLIPAAATEPPGSAIPFVLVLLWPQVAAVSVARPQTCDLPPPAHGSLETAPVSQFFFFPCNVFLYQPYQISPQGHVCDKLMKWWACAVGFLEVLAECLSFCHLFSPQGFLQFTQRWGLILQRGAGGQQGVHWKSESRFSSNSRQKMGVKMCMSWWRYGYRVTEAENNTTPERTRSPERL